jgi:hypothetical protein
VAQHRAVAEPLESHREFDLGAADNRRFNSVAVLRLECHALHHRMVSIIIPTLLVQSEGLTPDARECHIAGVDSD